MSDSPIHDLFVKLEPEACRGGYSLSTETALTSLAISAKRQADALEKLVEIFGSPDAYGLVGSAAISHAIEVGIKSVQPAKERWNEGGW